MAGKSKFNVSSDIEKRTCDGIVFDSKMEMEFYRDVVIPGVANSTIIEYELQKAYELQPKFRHNGKVVLPIKYVADFYIKYSDGSEEVIDIKGMPDSVALLKRKMFWYHFPDINYKWVTWRKKYGGWIDYDELHKIQLQEKKDKKNKNATISPEDR